MSALRKIVFILLTLVIVTACQTPLQPPVPQPTVTALAGTPPGSPSPTSILPTPSPASPLTPSPLPGQPAPARPQYEIEVSYDFSSHNLTVHERIAWPNRSGESIADILLVADNHTPQNIIRLADLQAPSGQKLGEPAWDGDWIRASLTPPLAPGETLLLDLTYRTVLPERVADPNLEPMVYGWSARQVNLTDWILYFPPWHAGRGWWVNPRGFYGEQQVYESADFLVTLTLENEPSGLQVAASAAPEEPEARGGQRRYRLENARTFAFSLLPLSESQTLTRSGSEVTSFWFPGEERAGLAALETAAQALEVYSELFGPYGRPSFTVVQSDFLDSMEFDGLVFVSDAFYNLYDGQPASWLTAITAHEVAHQWWFSQVANDQAHEPWLDEALCTFSELLYLEQAAPEAVNWWHYARINYYQPEGPVNETIYNPRKRPDAYLAYRNAVYLNGARFFVHLREVMGEAFLPALHEYLAEYQGGIATGEDFWRIMQSHAPSDLSPARERYFGN